MSLRFLFLASLLPVFAACRSSDKDELADPVAPVTAAVSWEYQPDSVPDLSRAALNKAVAEARQKAEKAPTPQNFLDQLTAERLAGSALEDSLKTARRLVAVAEGKPLPQEMLTRARLELAIAAARESRFSMARFYLDQVRKSPEKVIQASVETVEGVMALREGQTNDAARHWRMALVADPSFKAARLNLGYLYLRVGDGLEAKKLLNPLRSDWFAASGLIVASRQLGQVAEADQLCVEVMAKVPDHAPTLLNCALQKYQAHREAAEADILLSRVISASERPDLTEYAYLLRNRMRQVVGNRVKSKGSVDMGDPQSGGSSVFDRLILEKVGH